MMYLRATELCSCANHSLFLLIHRHWGRMSRPFFMAVVLLLLVPWLSGVVVSPAQAAAKKAKERLAVLDIEAKYGVKQDLAEGLSVIVRDTLHGYGEYQVMSQEDIKAVASREQLVQALGCDENSGQCLIDFGRKIGSRFMVAGSISKFGETYTVSLRMLDTKGATAGVVSRVSENCKCKEDDLIGTVQDVAAALLGKKAQDSGQNPVGDAVKRQAEEERKLIEEKKRLASEAEHLQQQKERFAVEIAAKIEEEKRIRQAEEDRQKEQRQREAEAEQIRIATLLRKEDEAAANKSSQEKDMAKATSQQRANRLDGHGNEYRDPTTGMEFVLIPAGCFQMGDTRGDGTKMEQPAHEVCLERFYMGKFEVTQEQYQKITGKNPASFNTGGRYPVESVSWIATQEFIGLLNRGGGKTYRLPTEAEWEYAAKAGTREIYSGGDTPDSGAWHLGNSSGATHPVGELRANAFGLYDMSGNVWEWCSDWYGAEYYKDSPKNSPTGPASGVGRIIRGGGWDTSLRKLRVVARDSYAEKRFATNLGFRLVLPIDKHQ